MTLLPLLLSVPHAGLEVPGYLQAWCRLSPQEIAEDGDVGAKAIYDLGNEVRAFVTTGVARAIVDMNRGPNDRRKDGVVKTHTCWDVAIYEPSVPDELLAQTIREHHQPYHEQLTRYADDPGLLLGIDCHTMAANGPPVGPDPGAPRPMVCVSDGNGETCPGAWTELFCDCLRQQFPGQVTLNEPFAGGYITRYHGLEMPWLQLEMSRTTDPSDPTKRRMVLAAFREWVKIADPALRRGWADRSSATG
jgi:formiminoglutamase